MIPESGLRKTHPRVFVIGSFMMDLVVRAPRLPADGETLIGKTFQRFPGGKGANQAVAAARLGGDVTMAGMLGKDDFGDEMIHVIGNENINVQHVLRNDDYPTGVGSITLDNEGENRIVVVPGANLHYAPEKVNELESLIASVDILVMQLEMAMSVTEQAVQIAAKHHVPVILNPAPANVLAEELLQNVTYLTPNESELELLTGMTVDGIEMARTAAKVLVQKGVDCVIVTLAEHGALIANNDGTVHVPGFDVQPKDTVAAGDAFNGALAVELCRTDDLQKAVRFANAVGALAVTAEGAIPSLPTLADVNRFLLRQSGSHSSQAT